MNKIAHLRLLLVLSHELRSTLASHFPTTLLSDISFLIQLLVSVLGQNLLLLVTFFRDSHHLVESPLVGGPQGRIHITCICV